MHSGHYQALHRVPGLKHLQRVSRLEMLHTPTCSDRCQSWPRLPAQSADMMLGTGRRNDHHLLADRISNDPVWNGMPTRYGIREILLATLSPVSAYTARYSDQSTFRAVCGSQGPNPNSPHTHLRHGNRDDGSVICSRALGSAAAEPCCGSLTAKERTCAYQLLEGATSLMYNVNLRGLSCATRSRAFSHVCLLPP